MSEEERPTFYRIMVNLDNCIPDDQLENFIVTDTTYVKLALNGVWSVGDLINAVRFLAKRENVETDEVEMRHFYVKYGSKTALTPHFTVKRK